MKAIVYILFIFLSISLFAQTPNFSLSIDLNNDSDQSWDMADLGDGLLLVRGGTCNGNQDFCSGLIRTDYDGNILWKKEYDYFVFEGIQSAAVTDSFIFLAAYFAHLGPLHPTHHVFKLDMQGDTLQSIELQRDSFEFFRSIVANEKGIIVASNVITGSPIRIRLRQFDFDGKQLWENWIDPIPRRPSGRYLLALENEEYILSYLAFQPNADYSLGISKFDSIGNTLWETTIDTVGSARASSAHIISTRDGGLATFFNEHYRLPYPWNFYPTIVYKLDANGNILWKADHFLYEFNKYPHALHEAYNGDIIGVGYAAFLNYQDILEYGGWVFRLDKDGNKLWERFILDTLISPTERKGDFSHLTELDNGDLLIYGEIEDTFPNHDPAINNPNLWLLKLDADGCFNPGCDSVQMHLEVITNAIEPSVSTLGIHPNPVGSFLRVQLPDQLAQRRQLSWRIVDSTGKSLRQGRSDPSAGVFELDVSSLPRGIYFFQLIDPTSHWKSTGKFVKA